MLNAHEITTAEATVRAGVASGNWTAAGLALIVDRLDAILDVLEENGE